MKKGSITVFLSLILVLMFSFLMTTLEAARIRGAAAYVSMLSELAGDSFLASYYYPLFENYRLFGVNMGNEDGYFSESAMGEQLEKNLVYGTEGLIGGLLRFPDIGVTGIESETLMFDQGAEFLAQVKKQTLLDGLSLSLNRLFAEEQFMEAGTVGQVYREQEKALTATANVTAEIIKLMELVDGICMGSGGIAFDEDGKMQAEEAFIKQLLPMEPEEIEASYENEEVFRTIARSFFRAEPMAERVDGLLKEAEAQEENISRSEQQIVEYKDCLKVLENEYKAEKSKQEKEESPDITGLLRLEKEIKTVEKAMEEEKISLMQYETSRDAAVSEARDVYNELKKKLDAVQELLADGLDVAEKLEKNQKTARVAVMAYEAFLKGTESKLSEELYQVFSVELEKMKIYVGLGEQGFSVEKMKHSLQENLMLLEGFDMAGFSERKTDKVLEEMAAVRGGMENYTAEGLWFPYGKIVVAEQTWENVTGFLGELLSTGILSLVGISKEEQSDRSLSGEDLPSAGLEKGKLLGELMTCINEVQALFQSGGIGAVLKTAGNVATDDMTLELYGMKYFHCYGKDSPYTKLNYEREYLLFGNKGDKSNLLSMVLYLTAIRTLFCMVMILKQPDSMAQIETLAMGVAGFTGVPALAAVVKYAVLMLWSVEEALVEVSALLQGKRVAVLGTGTVAFEELFLMNKSAIEGKARGIPDGIGAKYEDYLSLLSLTKGLKIKAYRAMDLIQENIRYRYNDSFRIRNVVTKLRFCAKGRVNKLFDAGIFPDAVYEPECEKEYVY